MRYGKDRDVQNSEVIIFIIKGRQGTSGNERDVQPTKGGPPPPGKEEYQNSEIIIFNVINAVEAVCIIVGNSFAIFKKNLFSSDEPCSRRSAGGNRRKRKFKILKQEEG